MDPRQQDALVQRLVRNPQDQAAIAEAHAAGQQDPEGYARLLEKVGLATHEPSLSSHWLNEAANVWLTTFQDPQRAANVLLAAIDRDPLSDATAKRVSDLYRASNDVRGLASLLERRAGATAQLGRREPDWLPRAAELYEELGRLLAEPPLSDSPQAKQAYTHAVDLDPTSQFAIYSLRELHKAAGEFGEALPYFGMEIALVTDPERKLALYLDEVEVAKLAGRTDRAQAALRYALKLDGSDPTLRQQLATLTLEHYRAGHSPSEAERVEAAELFVGLAEQFPGEHGFLYALCALELVPAHDRAVQLAIYFGEQLGRLPEVAPLAAAYVRDNPGGVLVTDARRVAGGAQPLSMPAPAEPDVSHAPKAGHAGAATTAAGAGTNAGLSSGGSQAGAPRSILPAGVTIDDLLERADGLARKSRKNEAIAVYRQVLDQDPINADALQYLQEQLPLKRKYAELREVLLAAVTSDEASDDDRLGWLREVAAVSETHLRDLDGAVHAWQRIVEIDSEDEEGPDQLKRLLERARRWDDLALVLQAEASRTEDLEARIALERNVAKLHAERRKDPAAAGEAWARICRLSPADEAALQEAVRWFEGAGRGDRAADVIAEHVAELDDDLAKRELYFKLGNLRVAQGQPLSAAESLAQGAEELGDAEMWARAETCFAQAEAWEPAAHAADEQAEIAEEDAQRAAHIARAAGHLVRGGDSGEAITRLEQAVALAPTHEQYSGELEELLVAADRVDEMVSLFLSRAAKLNDLPVRVLLRKRAAIIQRDRLGDAAAARASFALVLQDAEDAETLQWLAAEAEQRGDAEAAVSYLGRFVTVVPELERKIESTLHRAHLSAGALQDQDAAALHYEFILSDLDPKNESALEKLGALEGDRKNYARAAEVLEKYLDAAEQRETKLEVASRLAELYELHLAKPKDAIRLLNFIHSTDPDDLDATQRLCELAEAAGQWPLVAELMVELIAIEGEEDQVSEMTRRLAQILHTNLDNGTEALNVLGGVADQGDEACRQAYIELGDELGEKAIVARRIVAWHSGAAPSAVRSDALHAAFQRFVETDQNAEALAVAKDLATSDSLSPEVAETLERLSVAAKDLQSLTLANELRVQGLSGEELAAERVRQAEVLASLGVPVEQAVAHGEQSLAEVDVSAVEPLLARLANLCPEVAAKIDVYEHQVARSEALDDRLSALCRTAEFAAEQGAVERAGALYDVALAGSLDDAALQLMTDLVRAADKRAGKRQLTETLVSSLAAAGQGARDAGKTRARMLRRAATLAYEDLGDLQRAFEWLGDAVLSNVEDVTLDALEALGEAANDFPRAEAVLTRAVNEVFDGPLVRRLLARRAKLRRERLNDLKSASEDLKRLHELSPSDQEVAEELTALYETLGEYRGMVTLIEDQILRNRDKDQRSILARRVALLWQEQLSDAREAADAWRRVLRLIPGDEEAKQGLARAKEEMLESRAKDPVSVTDTAVLAFGAAPSNAASGGASVTGATDSAETPAATGESSEGESALLANAAKQAPPAKPQPFTTPHAAVPSVDVTESLPSEASAPASERGTEQPLAMASLSPAEFEPRAEPVESDEPTDAGVQGYSDETGQEALVDALRRSDLPPEDVFADAESQVLAGLERQRTLPPELDDFDTATEVTSRTAAEFLSTGESLEMEEVAEDGEIVVVDEVDEGSPSPQVAPAPPPRGKGRGGGSEGESPKSGSPRSVPPPRRKSATRVARNSDD